MAQGFIVEHFRRYRQLQSPWSFCWKTSIEGLIVGIAIIALIDLFLFSVHEPKKLSHIEFIIFGLLLAPPIETIFCQFTPINIVRSLRGSFRVQVLVSTVVFAIPHFLANFPIGIGAGIAGFYLAFTYAHWVDKLDCILDHHRFTFFAQLRSFCHTVIS